MYLPTGWAPGINKQYEHGLILNMCSNFKILCDTKFDERKNDFTNTYRQLSFKIQTVTFFLRFWASNTRGRDTVLQLNRSIQKICLVNRLPWEK